MRALVIGCLTVAGLALLVFVIAPAQEAAEQRNRAPGWNQSARSQPLSDFAICDAAHQAAKSGLKAPATAKFPDDNCKLLTRARSTNASGQTVWTVSGPVDAENVFGALLRSTYRVEITDVGDGSTYRMRVLSIE